MQQSRLLRIVGTFSSKEWKECDSFLKMHLTPDSELHRLWMFLSKSKSDLIHDKLSKKRVIAKLYPGKNIKNFLNLQSQLNRLVIDFLSYKNIEEKTLLRSVELVNIYNNRGLHKEAEKEYKKINLAVKNGKLSFRNSLYEHLAASYQYFSEHPVKYQKNGKILLQDAVLKLQNYTHVFYALTQLEKDNRIAIGNPNYKNISIPSCSEQMEESIIVKIINQCSILLNHQDESSYNYLKGLIITPEEVVLNYEIYSIICIFLERYIVFQTSQGDTSYLEDLMAIIKSYERTILSQKLIDIASRSFINYLNVATLLNEKKWAVAFMDTYIIKLPIKERQVFNKLAMSKIHIMNNQYDKAILQLSTIINADVFAKCIIQSDLLKCYYELYKNDTDFISNCVSNYLEFLNKYKKTMSKRKHEGSIHFAVILRMLSKLDDVSEIRKYISKCNYIFYRYYLESKIKEMMLQP